MLKEIQARFEGIEARRRGLVERVRGMTAEARGAKPSTGGFTPEEVIEHFALMEEFNVGFLDKNPPKALGGKPVAIRFLGKMVFKGLSTPEKYLAQTLPQAVPKSSVDLDAAAKHWEAVRGRMKVHLETVTDPSAAFIKMMWLFGTLSANDYFSLIEAHLGYHEARMPA